MPTGKPARLPAHGTHELAADDAARLRVACPLHVQLGQHRRVGRGQRSELRVQVVSVVAIVCAADAGRRPALPHGTRFVAVRRFAASVIVVVDVAGAAASGLVAIGVVGAPGADKLALAVAAFVVGTLLVVATFLIVAVNIGNTSRAGARSSRRSHWATRAPLAAQVCYGDDAASVLGIVVDRNRRAEHAALAGSTT